MCLYISFAFSDVQLGKGNKGYACLFWPVVEVGLKSGGPGFIPGAPGLEAGRIQIGWHWMACLVSIEKLQQ